MCGGAGGEEGVRSAMGSPGAGPMGFALHSQSNRQPVKGAHVTGAGTRLWVTLNAAGLLGSGPTLMSVPPGSWARLVPLLRDALSPLRRQVAVGLSQEATSSRGLFMMPLPFSVLAHDPVLPVLLQLAIILLICFAFVGS